MSSQFIQRIANYVANEVVIKGLANSRTFQRFAVRTNKQYNDMSKQSAEQLNKTLEEMAAQQAGGGASGASKIQQPQSSSVGAGPPMPPLRGIPGFFVAFAKEVRKDVAGQ